MNKISFNRKFFFLFKKTGKNFMKLYEKQAQQKININNRGVAFLLLRAIDKQDNETTDKAT